MLRDRDEVKRLKTCFPPKREKLRLVYQLPVVLIYKTVSFLGSTTPRSSIDLLSDIILALNKKYCDNLSRWLNTLLTQENFPSPRISAQQKDTFIKIVLRYVSTKTISKKIPDLFLIVPEKRPAKENFVILY